jgi:hypothetical protein
MTLSVDNVVQVSDVISPLGLLRRDFGISLFMTTDDILGTGSNRIAVLPDSDTGDEIFAAGSEPKKMYDVYFQQVPYPKNIIVGRWINADVGARLIGDTPALLSVFQAISDASFEMNGEDYTAINLSAALSYADVATAIQAAFAAGTDLNLKTAAVTYDAALGVFKIQCTTTGASSTLTFTSPVDPPVGTDISTLIGWDSASEAVIDQGADEETISEAIEACLALNDSPYFIELEETITDFDTINEVVTWVATRRYMFAAASLEAGALTTGESATVAAQIAALEPPRTWMTWSGTGDYKAPSSAGRLSSVNFSGNNTLITLNLKQLPGTLSDDITQTQKAELDRKNLNYYVPLFATGSPGADSYLTGITFKDGVWIDVRYFVDWLVNAIQVDVFNLLYASPKLPQTESGVGAIQQVIEDVCAQGVRNGGLAPGTLSAANILDVQNTTGNIDFDGFLPKGFLVYASPIAQQAQADRELRKAPPFKVWCKGAGAIHEVEISLVYEN